jgi:hypothetical protein
VPRSRAALSAERIILYAERPQPNRSTMEIRIIEQAQTGQLTVRLSGVSPDHMRSLCQSIGVIACQQLSIREWEIDAQQRADALRWIFDVRATIRNVTVVFLICSPGHQQLRLENKNPSRAQPSTAIPTAAINFKASIQPNLPCSSIPEVESKFAAWLRGIISQLAIRLR